MIPLLNTVSPDYAKFLHLQSGSVYSADPVDLLSFTGVVDAPHTRFDHRSDHLLKEVMFTHTLALERERALWEYADRHKTAAMPVLADFLQREPDRELRYGALWAVQRFAGKEGLELIHNQLNTDADFEVRSWADLFLRESTGKTYLEDTRHYCFDKTNVFDQTLPLLISGYALVQVPEWGWVQATLSPKWFEAMLGRVMACTNEATFDTNLIVEKRIFGYHHDGTDHCEIYKFKGFTYYPAPGISHHIYESRTNHTFYPSGKVKDLTVPPLHDVGVILNRLAEPWIVKPARPVRQQANLFTNTPEKAFPSQFVESVRGKYFGAAYINVERLMQNGFEIGPGEVQLSTLFHPIAGPLTNMFLFGSFKGKLSDLNGDGLLDLNTEAAHCTTDGQLDFGLKGYANGDPYTENIKN